MAGFCVGLAGFVAGGHPAHNNDGLSVVGQALTVMGPACGDGRPVGLISCSSEGWLVGCGVGVRDSCVPGMLVGDSSMLSCLVGSSVGTWALGTEVGEAEGSIDAAVGLRCDGLTGLVGVSCGVCTGLFEGAGCGELAGGMCDGVVGACGF